MAESDGPDLSTVRILGLASSAFVVLAAEPSYVLIDTAVVGHLGARQLGALGVGGTLLSLVAIVGGFLEYGTTARAARLFGAGLRSSAVDEGITATALGLVLGVLATAVGELIAGPMIRLLSGGGSIQSMAEGWFRIALLGLTPTLVVLAGNGWMRGVQETRKPVWIVVAANVISAGLCPILIFGFGLGLDGSALANVAAQIVGGSLFIWALARERRGLHLSTEAVRAQLLMGRDLLVREVGFQAAFLTASGVAARMGTAQIAAHQVGLQLWEFIALLLDSFAIAAQSLVGAALGGGNVAVARHTAARVSFYGLAAGLVAGAFLGLGHNLIPDAFSSSDAVRRQASHLWPYLAGMQPAAGVVFGLDGVLIGAGDVSFIRSLTLLGALGAFVPICVLSLLLGWGLGGVWLGLTAFIGVRLVGMVIRARGTAWTRIGLA